MNIYALFLLNATAPYQLHLIQDRSFGGTNAWPAFSLPRSLSAPLRRSSSPLSGFSLPLFIYGNTGTDDQSRKKYYKEDRENAQ